jgi:hypothetical protein
MVSVLGSGFESESASRAKAPRQAARAEVVSRPKKRQGKRLRSSRTTRAQIVGRSLNIEPYNTWGIEARYAFEFDAVIPGRVEGANPESRVSGFDASHRPGMTKRIEQQKSAG